MGKTSNTDKLAEQSETKKERKALPKSSSLSFSGLCSPLAVPLRITELWPKREPNGCHSISHAGLHDVVDIRYCNRYFGICDGFLILVYFWNNQQIWVESLVCCLRGGLSILQIVFVRLWGVCLSWICGEHFFPLAAKLIGSQTGCQFFKNTEFFANPPLVHHLQVQKKDQLRSSSSSWGCSH